jgi:Replication-relaxation
MRPNNKQGTMGVRKLRTLLTKRDHEILRSIEDHRFLTSKQIYQLHFWNHASYVSAIRACNRVLTRLRQHKLIYRLERQIGGAAAGSSSYVWGIDAAGDRLLRAQPGREDAKRKRSFEPTTMFLAHTLAIADTHVMLEEAARGGELELIAIETEPTNWRSFVGHGGVSQILKPDLYAVTATGDYEDSWFIEVDRGTEATPTLISKCLIYQRYWATGKRQAEYGVFPLVIWLMEDGTRRARVEAAIQSDTRLDPKLFRVIDPTAFRALVISPAEPSTDQLFAAETEGVGL